MLCGRQVFAQEDTCQAFKVGDGEKGTLPMHRCLVLFQMPQGIFLLLQGVQNFSSSHLTSW